MAITIDDSFSAEPQAAPKAAPQSVAIDDSFSTEPVAIDDGFSATPTETKPVFWDDATPLTPMAPDKEKEYLRMVNDSSVEPEAVRAFAEQQGFLVRPEDIVKSRAEYDEYRKLNPGATMGTNYQEAPVVVEKPNDGALGAGARGFGSGALASGLDELGAVVDTLGLTDDRENVFNSDRRFTDIWYDNQRKNSAILQNDEEEHPYAEFGGELAGGLVGLTAGSGAAGLLKTGAAYGGATGFLGTDGSFTDRAKGAAIGVPAGAALGFVGGKTIEGAGKLIKKLRGVSDAVDETVDDIASRYSLDDWKKQSDGSYVMEQNGAKYRVKPEDARVHEVVNEANRLAKGWKNAPEIEVVHSANKIPDPEIRAAVMQEAPDALGFLGRDGKVRLIASNIRNDSEIQSVLYHETLGHYGLAQKFGEDLAAKMDDLYQRGNGEFREAVDKWLADNPTAHANDPNRIAIAAEEVLAGRAQEGNAGFKSTVMDELTNMIKDYGRKMGVDLNYSEREIRSILGMAQNAVINGKATAADNGFRFLRGFNDEFNENHPAVVEAARLNDIPADRIKVAMGERDFQQEVRYVQRELAAGKDPLGDRRFKPLTEDEAIRMSQGEDVERYMRPRDRNPDADGENELYLPKAPREAVKVLEDGYIPTQRSWTEAQRMARERGLRPSEIRKMGDAAALDKKLFQMDNLAQRLDGRLAALTEKLEAGGGYDVKAEYRKTLYEHNMLLGHIMDNQAEVGRALQSIKAMSFTKKKLLDTQEQLKAHGGIDALDDDEVFERFVRAMAAQQGNPTAGQALAKQVVKPYWWQYALTYRHAAMLSGLGTHVKNAADNAFMIARELEETAMALPGGVIRKGLKAAGANVEDGVTPAEFAARSYGLLRAVGDMRNIAANTVDAFKQGHGAQHISKSTDLAEARIPIVSKVGDALHASDTFFRAFQDNANAYTQGVREAQKAGLTGVAAFQDGANRALDYRNPMKLSDLERDLNRAKVAGNTQMVNDTIAKIENYKAAIAGIERETNRSLLVDKPSSLMAKLETTKTIVPGMSGGEQAAAFAANMALPFFRVTDRLLFQKIRRSPLSILDRTTREDFRAGGARRDIAIARTLFGSALIWQYWNEAGEGSIVGEAPEFQKLAALQAGGYQPRSALKDGSYVDASGLNLSFNWADVQNNIAADIATIRAEYDRTGATDSVADKMGAVTRGILSTLSSSSFAENVSQYTDPFKTGMSDSEENAKTGNLLGSLASQFIPAMMRQYNSMVDDPIKRDTTGDKSVYDRTMGRIQSNLPSGIMNPIGLKGSRDLPVKYSVYGQELDQGKTLLGMYNYQEVKDDPEIKELQRLERTQEKPLVTRAPNRFNRDGVEIKLTGEEYATFQKEVGEIFLEGMKGIASLDVYQNAPDDMKKAAVKDLLKEARTAAKDRLYPEKGEELDLSDYEEEEE